MQQNFTYLCLGANMEEGGRGLGQAFSIISNANAEMIVFITHHLIIYRPYDLISISVLVPRKVESTTQVPVPTWARRLLWALRRCRSQLGTGSQLGAEQPAEDARPRGKLRFKCKE